ncbi:MAG: phosphonate C-P lyase system protein PhnG [Gammaproteobacteria bacterium]|nr:phosphonate C-P lyase system protein PhnG [Gammaproteobacteria bacterium]
MMASQNSETETPVTNSKIQKRQHWLSVLAKSPLEPIEKVWAEYSGFVHYELIRPPEIGLAMVRARTGGTGSSFNLGEITVTRAAANVQDTTGFGFIRGRNKRQAELMAVFDALLQREGTAEELMRKLIHPLDRALKTAADERSAKAAATKVEFFTMVRGEAD